jgi:hypothetical protein
MPVMWLGKYCALVTGSFLLSLRAAYKLDLYLISVFINKCLVKISSIFHQYPNLVSKTQVFMKVG